ncbi:TFP11-domain-containing protein [Microstroma glucosiphilum]|uniref:TFP11-domain-containing protein n=1 Tax=Pseudomicrostroma glucosiphilum TaxID=1684307 RepID=A0A316UH69_9BASI|nr:TFP11-domain-containing protein [Pseudomicrostroma glucosiphilum]PWN23283.1 TFP11-domain-containing protein [Pseudomicrostroma glucosiphilum]
MPASFGAVPTPVEPSDAFAKKEKKPKRSFLPSAASSVPKTSIKFGGGLGGGFNPAAYLASMGWTGGGLGENGEGMLNPIEVQLRPEKAGIAFGGRKERTKQAKEEAKRRGEEVSSDEDERAARRNKGRGDKKKEKKEQAVELRQAWTTREKKPRKPKIQHRTYEQIIEEAGGEVPSTDAGVGQIIDARSKEMKEVASLASALAHHAVPTSDSTRLPELRHNLRLIADNSKQTLDALAKEGAGIFERRRWLQREYDESRRRREKEAVDLAQLKVVLSLVRELEAVGKSALSNTAMGLEAFEPLAVRIQQESDADIEKFGLDEALVGALTPPMKRLLADWDPLQDADGISATLHRWRRALRALGGASAPAESRAIMLPFEALLWHLWMPRIRSALNNDWKVHHPRAAVAVLTAWRPLLPRYIWDNVLDQILLPKVWKAVHDWEPRTARAPLHYILFPWLPLLGERIDETMSEARRRIRALLKSWRPKDEAVPQHLERWKEFFPKSEWDSMFLTQIVPKLASYLGSRFSVNPRAQDMAPLEKILAWRELLRRSVLSRLLEGEFFPKWLTTLHAWLVQPGVDLGEVAKWYSFWKGWFPSEVAALPGVEAGFRKGIALINQAVEMGEDRRGLSKPDLTPLSRSSVRDAVSASHRSSSKTPAIPSSSGAGDAEDDSVSFRSIVEDRAAELDLLVLSLNRSHAQTGLPLLRVSESLDGKSGATFYVQEDIVWVEEKDKEKGTSEWIPVGVEELMKRARMKR